MNTFEPSEHQPPVATKNRTAQKIGAILLSMLAFLAISLPGFASADLCDEMSKATKGFFSCGTQTTSFTSFTGTLSTPDASQYAPGLAQNQDLRQFIKNVVNFALGFLGLLSVIIVIYGGVLYVTAAGKEEQAGKGKKAITYAVIGILIILSSFALVNTVLLAGGGTDQNTTNGSAPGGTSANQNAQRQALFAYAGSVVQTVARDFVTGYQNYSEINTDLTTLSNTDAFTDVSTAAELKADLQQKRTILTNIISKAGALSQVAEKGRAGLLLLDKYINAANSALDRQSNVDTTTGNLNVGAQLFGLTDYGPFKADIDSQFAAKGDLSAANAKDFAQAVYKANDALLKLRNQLKQAASLPDVDVQLGLIVGELHKIAPNMPYQVFAPQSPLMKFLIKTAAAQSLDLTLDHTVTNAEVLQIVNDLSNLYDMVKDLQFVYTVITADKAEGNAPLPVSFDGLKSLDPNNRTIDPSPNADCSNASTNGCYQWDFGDAASGPDNTLKGATGNHIFQSTGTYVVKLTIKAPKADTSKGEKQPADGIAYQTITVKPPIAKIILKATIPGQPDFYLSQYDENGNQTIDLQNLQVTLTEAKQGITFDASGTKPGAAGTLAKIHWDFGDKTNSDNIQEGPPDQKATVQAFKYNKEGTYRVTLEITDDRGVTDRKIFNVIVNSLVARVQASPGQFGQLGDQFQFQSLSASDAGQISKYTWSLKNSLGAAPANFTPPAQTADSFKYTFTAPGSYDLGLTVDNGSTTATADVPLKLKSKPPVAQFSFTNADPTHPNIYILDGAGSYDPDGTPDEKIQYKWEVNAAPGDCTYYKVNSPGPGFQASGSDCTQLGTEGVKGFNDANGRLKFKFKKGQYTVTLDVQDPADPNNSVPQEQQITVASDLDVGWSDDGKPLTTQLKDGSAIVTFNIKSDNGIAYQLDTGDGGKEQGNMAGGTATAKHTYSTAGAFKVKLTVYDAQDNGNATYRKVFIGSADAPIAAIGINANGEDISDTSSPVEGNRTTVFTFDGNKSMNIDGSARNLNYSWDFGDGTDKSTKKIATHIFKEIGDKQSMNFTVSLKVSDIDTGKTSTADTLTVTVRRLPPVVNGLSAIPVSSTLVTPIQVSIAAQGATDPDGKIVTFKWWYYDINDPETQLGVQITQSPTATLTIGTNGEESRKKTYKFGVIATDNENDKFDSGKDLNEALIPSLEVTNGPNKAPISKFSVDKTNILVNESVNFSSSSTDPDKDGKIVNYMWNFEAKGYTDPGDPAYDKANVSYKFTTPAKDGVKVRLKVRDNNGAESVSDPVTIFVDAKSGPPTAAFTSRQLTGKKIQFTNNSTADAANGANLKSSAWDFDVNSDANGDGIKDNDIQSPDANPVFEYPDYAIYRAKLTVTDDQGNSNNVSNFVNVKAPAAVQTQQTAAAPLDARLITTPAPNVADGRVHLQGDSEEVTLDFSTSTGNIASYVIDKNVYFDSNGNGIKDDDEDYKTDKPGSWATQFFRSYGATRVRLTVVDAKGNKDIVDKDIVFDPAPGATTPLAPALGGTTSPTLGDSSAGSPSAPGASPKNPLSAFVLAGYEVVDWQILLVSLTGFGIFIASTLNKKKHATNK